MRRGTASSNKVSLIATTGIQFDLDTPQGKLIANIMACLAEFERDLVREGVRSGLAAAKARGQKLGDNLVNGLKPTVWVQRFYGWLSLDTRIASLPENFT